MRKGTCSGRGERICFAFLGGGEGVGHNSGIRNKTVFVRRREVEEMVGGGVVQRSESLPSN